MQTYQYVVIVAVGIGATRIFLRLRKNKITLAQFFFWEFLWLAILTFALFPGKFSFLSNLLGIGRTVDAVVYGSVLLLFYLMYKTYLKLMELQRDISKIVRHIAIQESRLPEKND